jgi:hypothetical protein
MHAIVVHERAFVLATWAARHRFAKDFFWEIIGLIKAR